MCKRFCSLLSNFLCKNLNCVDRGKKWKNRHVQNAQNCRCRENYEKYYQNTVHKFST